MTTNINNDAMVSKIEALIRKAESTEHQAEADAFMAKAFELCTKYGFDAEAIQRRAVEAETARMIKHTTLLKSSVWREDVSLAGVVAKHMGCAIMYTAYASGWPARVYWYGKEDLVQKATLLFTLLQMQRDRASKRRAKDYWRNETQREFASGFAVGVHRQFKTAQDEVAKEDPSILPAIRSEVDQAKEFADDGRASRMQPAAPGRQGVAAGSTADVGRARISEGGRLGIGSGR